MGENKRKIDEMDWCFNLPFKAVKFSANYPNMRIDVKPDEGFYKICASYMDLEDHKQEVVLAMLPAKERAGEGLKEIALEFQRFLTYQAAQTEEFSKRETLMNIINDTRESLKKTIEERKTIDGIAGLLTKEGEAILNQKALANEELTIQRTEFLSHEKEELLEEQNEILQDPIAKRKIQERAENAVITRFKNTINNAYAKKQTQEKQEDKEHMEHMKNINLRLGVMYRVSNRTEPLTDYALTQDSFIYESFLKCRKDVIEPEKYQETMQQMKEYFALREKCSNTIKEEQKEQGIKLKEAIEDKMTQKGMIMDEEKIQNRIREFLKKKEPDNKAIGLVKDQMGTYIKGILSKEPLLGEELLEIEGIFTEEREKIKQKTMPENPPATPLGGADER